MPPRAKRTRRDWGDATLGTEISLQGNREARRIEAIMRHYLETGDDTSQSERAYKPPFPHPTKEELKVALSEAVGKRERDRPRATLHPGVGTHSLARAKAARMAGGLFADGGTRTRASGPGAIGDLSDRRQYSPGDYFNPLAAHGLECGRGWCRRGANPRGTKYHGILSHEHHITNEYQILLRRWKQ